MSMKLSIIATTEENQKVVVRGVVSEGVKYD